ncbi:MAG: acetoacetyl-CoA reductase [Gammaproteobacteria bacterium]|nr:MAG: acetoacetyl-CoA reductase [Gammaproteobacteria bacterium]
MENRVALVTGGTGGIGTAICQKLTSLGARVITTYRSEEKARLWQFEQTFDVEMIACDVSDYEDCEKLRENIEADFGQLDILVNNAGITRDASFKKLTRDKWSQVISTNLDSVFNVTHQFVNGMAERGFGRVINISSINGQKGQFGQTNYSAAKAGVHGFTMALAQEVARKGVTVNTISPGYIATEMVMAVPEEVREKIIAQIPVGRLGKPEEIAALVAFLSSDDAAFITGANLAANGGQHMH